MLQSKEYKKVLFVIIGIVIMFCAGCGLTIAWAVTSPLPVNKIDALNKATNTVQGSYYPGVGYLGSSSTETYLFAVTSDTNYIYLANINNSFGAAYSAENQSYYTYTYNSTYDSTTQSHYVRFSQALLFTMIPSFDTYADAVNEIRNPTPPEPDNESSASLEIPAGYVAWIYQNPADNVTLTQTLGTKVRNQTSVNMPKSQYWYRTNDTPIGSSMTNQNYPLSGMVPITWTKAPDAKTDALGLYNEVQSTDINIGSGSKIVIYNPYYFEAEEMLNQSVAGETKVNSSIYITGSWYKFDIYPVDEQFTNNNGEWSTNGTPTVNDDGRAQA